VGATEQVLLTAVRAKGTTELRNAAIEPEIMDLIAVLQKMGAIISYEPNRVIFIEGVDTLRGYDHRAIFDRNEAASWACAALATDGDIFVGGAKQQEMLTFLNVFRKAGGDFDIARTASASAAGELKPVVVETDVHPGFMTDWQQPLIVALTQAEGVSTVHETVYENRLGFTQALNKMGADIVVHPDGSRAPSAAWRAAPRAGRRHHRSDAAARRRRRRARPARRLQLRHRGARREGESRVRASTSSAAATRSSSTSSPPWAPTSTSWMRRVPPRARLREKTRPSVFWPARRSSCPSSGLIAKIEITARSTCRRRAYVLAPNHYSEFDPLIVAVATWRLGRAPRFMAKESLFRVPVLGRAARDRHDPGGPRDVVGRREADHRAVRGARRARSRRHRLPGGIAHARSRPVADARQDRRRAPRARGEIPVIPMATWGVQQILPRYGKLSLWPPRKRVRVALGPAVDLDPTAAGRDEREPRRRHRRRHGRHRGAAGGSAR
jgi:1-acyl-sn-glycerol-3-phosphate acyltransferase